MPLLHLKKGIAMLAMASLLAAVPASAQDSFARQDQLSALSADLSDISTRVKSSIDQTMSSMQQLQNYTGDDQTKQAFAILDSIESETRAVIDKIKVTSPFMSALDDARATVLVLLRKNERDPPSPERDARIAKLTSSLNSIDEQAQKILAAEGAMTALLAEHAQRRAELVKNGEVEQVQRFVADLSDLTAELERMSEVLADISNNIVVVPTEASLASE